MSLAGQEFRIRHYTGGGIYRRPFVLQGLIPESRLQVVDDWRPRPAAEASKVRAFTYKSGRILGGPYRRTKRLLTTKDEIPAPMSLNHIPAQIESLRAAIEGAGLPNFLEPGVEDSIAVHYRLGDYFHDPVVRRYFGVIGPEGIAAKVSELQSLHGNLKVHVYSEEPEFAAKLLVEAGVSPESVLLERSRPSDIWRDTYSMTRSRFFIGSNSGVSVWMAISKGEQAFLPDPWFAGVGKHLGAEKALDELGRLRGMSEFSHRYYAHQFLPGEVL